MPCACVAGAVFTSVDWGTTTRPFEVIGEASAGDFTSTFAPTRAMIAFMAISGESGGVLNVDIVEAIVPAETVEATGTFEEATTAWVGGGNTRAPVPVSGSRRSVRP